MQYPPHQSAFPQAAFSVGYLPLSDAIAKATMLVKLIQQQRFDLSTEKRMQAQLAEVLTSNNIQFEREKVLSARDTPDFLVADGVVIECKVRGARKIDTYRQLCRYAEHASVRVLILASNLSMGLPSDIGGKPMFCASCSRGWL